LARPATKSLSAGTRPLIAFFSRAGENYLKAEGDIAAWLRKSLVTG
jgi:hypothetical protein